VDVNSITGDVYLTDASLAYEIRILVGRPAGPKADTELLLNTAGNPRKITRAERFREFWVAVSVGINSDGIVLQTVSFATQYFNKIVNSVQERGGKLYVGSRLTNFIVIYSN
ncbi:strictosidine synthase-like 11-like protein, partial [Tanacetum coccineum]